MSFYSGNNSGRKLKFNWIFSAIVCVIGTQADSYGAFLVQGYGIGSDRIHIAAIHAGSAITCTVVEGEEIVWIKNATVAVSGTVFMLQGALPEILT